MEENNSEPPTVPDSQVPEEKFYKSLASPGLTGQSPGKAAYTFEDANRIFGHLAKIGVISFLVLGALWQVLRSHIAPVGQLLLHLLLFDFVVFFPLCKYAEHISGRPELLKIPLHPVPHRLILCAMIRRLREIWGIRIKSLIRAKETFKGQWIITFIKWLSAAWVAMLAWSFDGDGFSATGSDNLKPLLYAPVGISFLISLLAHLMPAVLAGALAARVGPWRVALAISVPVGVLTALGFIFGGVKVVDLAARGQLAPETPLVALGSYSLVGGLLGLVVGCMQVVVDISTTAFIPARDKRALEEWYSRLRGSSRSISERSNLCLSLIACCATSMLIAWTSSPHLHRFGDAKILATSLAPAYRDQLISIMKHEKPRVSADEIAQLSRDYADTLSQLAPSRQASLYCSLVLVFLVFLYVLAGILWDFLSNLDARSTPAVARIRDEDKGISADADLEGTVGHSGERSSLPQTGTGPQRASANEDTYRRGSRAQRGLDTDR